MKVQIQDTLISTEPSNVREFNHILKCALRAECFKQLDDSLSTASIKEFRWGFGSSHCWVKEFHSYGTLSENRLLFISK